MTIKDLKSIFLRKGWAGKTLSREETAQRLNPLIEAHVKLKHAYANLSNHLASDRERNDLESILKTLRLDIGKLKELVFSCGETAFNGISLEPESFELSGNAPYADLLERENSVRTLLDVEQPIEHQIRTEAVLTRLRKNSNSRLSFARSCVRAYA
ncbi:MAG: hypothetical protein OXE92_02290 [Bacteroidetes bacterium]|nr:hypothetical protein [Bacteroidota bacterium]MCY4204537.1 hypothetical protein [Bacteroidota bacterium]